MTNVKSLLALYVKMGGSLTDTYSDIAGGIPVGQYSLISDAVLSCSKKYSSGGGLPADFPAEGIANANKFLGFDNSGDYAALDAPSGAEKFVVTLTEDDDTWTADKTITEIMAADADGKDVVVSFQYMGQLPTELPKVSWIHDPEVTGSLFIFSGIIYGESETVALVVGQQGDSSDVWQVTFTPIPTSSTAPLIVTLTADQSTGNFVGDKTNKEVYDAFSAGQAVVLSASVGSSAFKLAVQYASYDGTDYEFAFIDSSAVKNTVSGGANDYVTASLA